MMTTLPEDRRRTARMLHGRAMLLARWARLDGDRADAAHWLGRARQARLVVAGNAPRDVKG